jgi:hypothetical protein
VATSFHSVSPDPTLSFPANYIRTCPVSFVNPGGPIVTACSPSLRPVLTLASTPDRRGVHSPK